MANSGGGGEFKSDIRKQEKMKFVSVGHHHAAGLEYAMKELGTYILFSRFLGKINYLPLHNICSSGGTR